MKNALKLVFFFEILMKFCRNFTNIFRKCQNLRRIAENSENFAKILSKSRIWWDYSIVRMNYSVVSLATSSATSCAAGSATSCAACCSATAVGHDTSLFSRLVLGCIETKFCNQIRIFSGFSRSTKLSSWFFEKVAKFCKKSQNLQNFCEISGFLQKKCWFLRKSLIFCKILQNFWKFSQIVL